MTNASLRDAAYRTAYKQWFAALSPEERRRLAKLGLDKPEGNHHAGPGVGIMEDAAERNEASEWIDVVSELEAEPIRESDLATEFAKALAWTTQGRSLVNIGQRVAVVLHYWKPALIAGMTLEIERDGAAATEFAAFGPCDACLGPFLEWLSRGTSLSQWGQRVLAAAYVMHPGLIEAPTLGGIGALNNKTRQAVDKLVQDFRDTFGGIKSRSMRSEENRKRCRTAQLQRA